jgi:hypothetical protein
VSAIARKRYSRAGSICTDEKIRANPARINRELEPMEALRQQPYQSGRSGSD